jgi:hypothetical protein
MPPSTALMMEAVSTSETSVSVYQTTRRNIAEGSHLQTTRYNKLVSRKQAVTEDGVCAP